LSRDFGLRGVEVNRRAISTPQRRAIKLNPAAIAALLGDSVSKLSPVAFR
jgi:hypothetical protein